MLSSQMLMILRYEVRSDYMYRTQCGEGLVAVNSEAGLVCHEFALRAVNNDKSD